MRNAGELRVKQGTAAVNMAHAVEMGHGKHEPVFGVPLIEQRVDFLKETKGFGVRVGK
jgi:hypothetical protein